MNQNVLAVAVGLLACCASASHVPSTTRPELDWPTSAAVRAGCSDDIDIANLTPVTLAQLSAGVVDVDARSSNSSGGGREAAILPPAVRRSKTLGQTVRIGFYFLAWYAFDVTYMFNTKALLKVLPFPWTVAASQHGMSLLLALGVRLPALASRKVLLKISKSDAVAILPPAVLHVAAHVLTVMALRGRRMTGLFFAVTAAEPALSAIMSAVFVKSFFRWQVYAALVPVVAGAALATVSRLSFSWTSLWIAVGSSAAFSGAAVLSKNVMSNTPRGEVITAHDLYSIVTAISFLLSIPLAVGMEGRKIKRVHDVSGGMILKWAQEELPWTVAAGGVSHYLRNVMVFRALSAVHPVTHAIGSSIKWVAISTSIVVHFKPSLAPMATLGSAIVIAGALLYSLAQALFPNG